MDSEYREYITALSKLDKLYIECPFRCERSEKKFVLDRSEYCDSCPTKKQRRTLERQVEEALQAMLGDDHGYKFNELLDAYYKLKSLRPMGDKILYKNSVALAEIRPDPKPSWLM